MPRGAVDGVSGWPQKVVDDDLKLSLVQARGTFRCHHLRDSPQYEYASNLKRGSPSPYLPPHSASMSRLASSRPAPAPALPGGGLAQDGELHTILSTLCLHSDTPPEICPVCKSSRYLKPDLRFLVNPECYHKMCETCVGRIFTSGPAQCPIPGCKRTLRKHRFRVQTFEDIQVEREVDIRKRVAAVFNKREEDFESLRDWNDYLNDVEDITFNLVNNVDVEETTKRFEAYQKANEKEIIENASREEQDKLLFAQAQKAEREQARLRRDAARREEMAERRELEEGRRDVLNALAAGGDAEKVAKEGHQVQLKRRLNRKEAAERQQQLQDPAQSANGSSNLVIKGLKARQKAEPLAPIDPFGGLSLAGRKYHFIQDKYVWTSAEEIARDPVVSAGGYEEGVWTQRILSEAFAGLGIFLAEEKADESKVREGEEEVGTRRAEVGAKDVKMEDPF